MFCFDLVYFHIHYKLFCGSHEPLPFIMAFTLVQNQSLDKNLDPEPLVLK